MKQSIFMPVLIAIILAGSIYIYFQSSENPIQDISNKLKKVTSPDEEYIVEDTSIEETEDIAPENVADIGGGEEGASAGADQTGLESSCIIKQISYRLKDFYENSFCNSLENETCIDKTTTCSLMVENLDLETTGDFTIEFQFQANDEEVFATLSQTQEISAGEKKLFEASLDIQPPNSEKTITCNFNAKTVPSKEVCS